MNTTSSDHVRPIDQSVLEALRAYGRSGGEDGDAEPGMGEAGQNSVDLSNGMTVTELQKVLGVTATAIRQRLDRLVQMELISRTKKGVGRGRPQYRYRLTQEGLRCASASYAGLAAALWHELLDLPNPQQRSRILRRVAKRMGADLRESLPESGEMEHKLSATADALEARRVPAAVKQGGSMPVLEVHACPYPELTERDGNRQLCEMEQEMLSEALGQEIQLDSCRLDGHQCCQFRPVNSENISEEPNDQTQTSNS